jgi:hypothetical protein
MQRASSAVTDAASELSGHLLHPRRQLEQEHVLNESHTATILCLSLTLDDELRFFGVFLRKSHQEFLDAFKFTVYQDFKSRLSGPQVLNKPYSGLFRIKILNKHHCQCCRGFVFVAMFYSRT